MAGLPSDGAAGQGGGSPVAVKHPADWSRRAYAWAYRAALWAPWLFVLIVLFVPTAWPLWIVAFALLLLPFLWGRGRR